MIASDQLARLPGVWVRRIADGHVTAAQAAMLLPYAKRRELLRVIDVDWRQCRWAWLTEEDFRRGIDLMVKKWQAAKPRGRRSAMKAAAATIAAPALAEASLMLPDECTTFSAAQLMTDDCIEPPPKQTPSGESWDDYADAMARWERMAITQEVHRQKAESWQEFVWEARMNEPSVGGRYRDIDAGRGKYWASFQWSKSATLFVVLASTPGARVSRDDALRWLEAGGLPILGAGAANCDRVATCFVYAPEPEVRRRIERFEFPYRPEPPSAGSAEEWRDWARRCASEEREVMESAYPDAWRTIRYQEAWRWNAGVTVVALMTPDRRAALRCDVAWEEMLALAGIQRLGQGATPDGYFGWMFVAAPLDKVKAALNDWIMRGPTLPWDEPGYVFPDEDEDDGA